jgi:hypothetical protein
MNDKKNPLEEVITAEEKKILLGGTPGYLQLSSLPEALRDKTPAFKAYLALTTLIVVVIFVASFAGSAFSLASVSNTSHPADLQIHKIRVFLGLLLTAAFYAQLLSRREVFTLLVSYAALCTYFLASGATRLLRLLPDPGLGFYMYVLVWLGAIILLLLFAREAPR